MRGTSIQVRAGIKSPNARQTSHTHCLFDRVNPARFTPRQPVNDTTAACGRSWTPGRRSYPLHSCLDRADGPPHHSGGSWPRFCPSTRGVASRRNSCAPDSMRSRVTHSSVLGTPDGGGCAIGWRRAVGRNSRLCDMRPLPTRQDAVVALLLTGLRTADGGGGLSGHSIAGKRTAQLHAQLDHIHSLVTR
jgi:hypothetical protein